MKPGYSWGESAQSTMHQAGNTACELRLLGWAREVSCSLGRSLWQDRNFQRVLGLMTWELHETAEGKKSQGLCHLNVQTGSWWLLLFRTC